MRIKGWVMLAAVLRRLYFENHTLTAADLRSKVERSWDEPPKRRPPPERHSQLETIKAKLTGVDLRGPNEPSHHLIDLCAAMVEESVLRYIQWEDLPSRADELTGGNKIKEWKPIASRTLKEVSSEELKNTDLKIYQAFNRQGVALEMSHDRLTKLFTEEYQKEPPDGYSKVRADDEACTSSATRHAMASPRMAGVSVPWTSHQCAGPRPRVTARARRARRRRRR